MDKVPLAELEAFVKKVLATLPAVDGTAVLIALRGNLGSGKTTFVQALCKELGVVEGVKSPTYVLMKSYDINYKGFTKLIHIDAYRLETLSNLKHLSQKRFFVIRKILCVSSGQRGWDGCSQRQIYYSTFLRMVQVQMSGILR
jgi:tRNA threonylcarbamoyladenosine biosynthesis protein TsaE